MQHKYSSLPRWTPRPLAALGLLLATAGAHAQTPAATFAPAATYSTGTYSNPRGIAVADVNGDGKLDLLTANDNGTAGVLLGNGNGTFQPAAAYSTGGSGPFGIAAADVNRDGKPDLVIANLNSSNASVLLGNGNGSFQAAVTYSTGGNIPFSVAVADINGDGKPDILAPNSLNNNVGVLLGNGDGTFQAATTFGFLNNPRAIAVADVNGDNKPDILTANTLGNAAGVLLGNGNGGFGGGNSNLYNAGFNSNPEGITVADVNGDGKPDLLTANADGSGSAGVLLGNGNGTFQAATTFGTRGGNPRGIVVADVNGDSLPDILTANQGGTTASVLLGNGNGTFQPAVTFGSGGYSPYAIAVADINGDGKPDLLTANGGSSTVGVLLNTTGLAVPTLASISPTSGLVGTSVTLTGTNLTGATAVSFNGTPAATFSVVNSTTITTTVPTGATSGIVTVTTPSGTSGSNATFAVPTAPVVNTATVNSVRGTSAGLGGTVVADGGGTVVDRGVVYSSTTTAPAIGGAGVGQDANGAGLGSFFKIIGGLAPSTTYTARAYATNAVGTSYGAAASFTTLPATSVVSISRVDASPTNASTVRFTVVFADPVTGLSASNFSLPVTGNIGGGYGGTITSVSGTGTTYTVTLLTGTGAGTVGLNLVNDNNLTPGLTTALPFVGPTYTLDKVPPTARISSPTAPNLAGTTTSPLVFNITYSEPVTFLTPFSLANVTNAGPGSTITGNGTTGLVLTIVPAAVGQVAVTVPANSVADVVGNTNGSAQYYAIYYNSTTAAPVLTAPATGTIAPTNQPTYTGTASAGSTVTIYLATGGTAQAIGTTTATGGSFSLTQPTALANGTYSVYATAQSPNSSASANSNLATFVVAAPSISSLSPAAGLVGTQVTVLGTNLMGTTAVSFNGTPASSFVVNSATSITAVVAAGTTGPVTVTTPTGSATSSASFVVRVPPTTVADAYTTPADVPLTGNVLTNDLGTNPRAILILYPTHGTLIFYATGAFSYRANAGYSGPDSFHYYACDQGTPLLCGNPVTVNITVTPGRVAPVTVADSYTTPQGVVLTGNVLTNDLDTNPRAILIIRPTRGVLVLNPDGSFSYQPNAGFSGSDSFIYYACDPAEPLLCGNPVTVSITVLPAGSNARSVAPTAGAATGATVALELALAGHPNPFADELQLSFALPIAQTYTLALYDAQGRLVRQLASGQAEAGQAQELTVPTHTYAAGLYLVRLTTATGTQLLKLVKH
jgi:hypothetical protein